MKEINPHESIRVLSFGCSANFGEGEMIAGLLQEQGYALRQNPQDGGITVLNLCTVKGDSSALKEIARVRQQEPTGKLVLTGCVTPELQQAAVRICSEPVGAVNNNATAANSSNAGAGGENIESAKSAPIQVADAKPLHGQEVAKSVPPLAIATTHALRQMPEIVRELQAGKSPVRMEKRPEAKVNLPRVSYNPVVGIVPVSNGCMDACSFCSTRLVKGKLLSYGAAEIVQEVRTLVASGHQQIWLTGQDSACWGFEFGDNLARLVKRILREVPGDYFLRIGMGNPRHTMEYLDELVEVFEDPRVFRFIHLPVQSGSSAVLSGMKRRHSVDDYLHIAQTLQKRYNDLTLSTDIIVGFPGESEEDFQQTLHVLEQTRPSICNRTRFVPRRGTLAAKMTNQIPKNTKKDRSARLTEAFKHIALQNNQEWEGWTGELLVDEQGKNGSMLGRNYAYRQIAIKAENLPPEGLKLGDRVQVKIVRGDVFYSEAELA